MTTEEQAFRHGAEAALSGRPRNNPYALHTDSRRAWHDGFGTGQKVRERAMAEIGQISRTYGLGVDFDPTETARFMREALARVASLEFVAHGHPGDPDGRVQACAKGVVDALTRLVEESEAFIRERNPDWGHELS